MKSQLVAATVTIARKLTENGARPELGLAASRSGSSAFFLPTLTRVCATLRIAARMKGGSR